MNTISRKTAHTLPEAIWTPGAHFPLWLWQAAQPVPRSAERWPRHFTLYSTGVLLALEAAPSAYSDMDSPGSVRTGALQLTQMLNAKSICQRKKVFEERCLGQCSGLKSKPVVAKPSPRKEGQPSAYLLSKVRPETKRLTYTYGCLSKLWLSFLDAWVFWGPERGPCF